jgi:hypothetical protein
MLTQLSPGEVWGKHATYGGPYTPRLFEPIMTHASGRETALKQNRLRNTYPREKVEEKIARFLRKGAGRELKIKEPLGGRRFDVLALQLTRGFS